MNLKIAITMGDPAGVGPETIAAALTARTWPEDRLVVLGHSEVLRRAMRLIGSDRPVHAIGQIEELDEPVPADAIVCLDCVDDDCTQVPPATIDPRGGNAAYQATAAAAALAMAGKIDAMVTAPLHKEALHQAGYHWPGHTEMLADLCGVSQVAMMLYLPPYDAADPTVAGLPDRLRLGPIGLGVGHATLHIGLKDAIAQLTTPRIIETASLVNKVMQGFAKVLAKDRPVRIGVAALNPHAGENGLFGDEESTVIRPAIEQGRRRGIDLSPALPCDTLMVRAAAGEFDGIVAMYHDQGHIALKLMGMQRAVNIALGLPIIRTSVAHGTAFDRAWQGIAHHDSLLHAIGVAKQLAAAKIQW